MSNNTTGPVDKEIQEIYALFFDGNPITADISSLDVLFMDIAMGKKDGMSVAKEISDSISANSFIC